MRRITLLCSIALAAVASGAMAAPQKAPAKKPAPAAAKAAPAAAKPAPAPAAAPAQAPWKPSAYPGSASALPAGYKGDDPLRFLDILVASEKKQAKDEFETTAAYEARMANATDLIAPLDMQTTYAFQMEVASKYDADKQAFTFGREYDEQCAADSYTKEDAAFVCTLKTDLEPSEKYEAQNGYGARFTVTKIRGRKVGITVPKAVLSKSDVFKKGIINSFAVNHTLAMPLDQASQLRGKTIAMLFVGKMAGTKKVPGRALLSDATSSRPTDIFVMNYGLPFAPTEIVFYVVETGQVLEAIKV